MTWGSPSLIARCAMNAYAAARHGEIASTATKRSSDEVMLASAQPAAVLPHTGRERTPMTDSLRVIGSRRYGTLSPLRYPGGKAALAGFFADIITALGVEDARYIEPYAGGVGAGCVRSRLVAGRGGRGTGSRLRTGGWRAVSVA